MNHMKYGGFSITLESRQTFTHMCVCVSMYLSTNYLSVPLNLKSMYLYIRKTVKIGSLY